MSRVLEDLIEAASDVAEDALLRAGPGSPSTTTVSFYWLNRLITELERAGVKFERDGSRWHRCPATLQEKQQRDCEETR